MRLTRLLGLAIIIAFSLCGCMEDSSKPGVKNGTPAAHETDNNAKSNDSQGSHPNQDTQPAPADEITHAVWMAAGDVMMHMPQLPSAYDAKKKKYDFSSCFDQVKPIFKQADWSLVNLETPIGGKELGYSGFPRFNAPSELADALKYAGVTIVTNANNHAT